jgi:Uma2 family endonuclease
MPGTSHSAARLTYDDLVAMFPDEDGLRREIIGGELFVTPSPFRRHQRIVRRLAISLGVHLDTHPDQGEMFIAPFDVVMTQHDVVEPDLLVVLSDQHVLTERNIQGAPALVIEVHSPGTRKRDQTLKRDLFDRQGVREYWMVDPDLNQVIVCRRAADKSFQVASTLSANETLTTTLLPNWSLTLAQLFK